ncbi:type VI secretion system-associated FHA domain protein TagH [uncultured Roseibium sp.]|uniref:type VI secretion system-associated FHA domain protein TagH n=1 Tax=uncultured Roseibium sp. TaxID=1936171 RepID=UPI00261FB2DA|nr:type VI secretion system-associated FHA domain protein TagH [uncultured Roseibium sp.]
MRITLQIENVDRLETGGQVSYSCADRGFDIGRHEHLDWSLPDPQRVISGRHCEVRYEGGQYVLYDVSTNGTFLNGSPNRMDKEHVLRPGDKVMIGDYIIVVSLDVDESHGSMASVSPNPAPPQWQAPQPAAPAMPDPAWPSAPPAHQHAPYPVEQQGGPWASGPAGMEGRHAPPSSAPGIGTPADDVWSRQGHGWGSADPSLYDPHARAPEPEQVRPALADPMDHLADQPHLNRPEMAAATPAFPQQDAPQSDLGSSPFPALSDGEAGADDEKPLFNMPDLGRSDAEVETPQAPPPSQPEPQTDAPFPEAPDWAAAQIVEKAASAEETAPETIPEAPKADMTVAPAEQPEETVSEPIVDKSALRAAPEVSVDFIKAFAEGAGIPEDALQGRDQEAFARELGVIMQGITSDLMGLLQARSQVKAMTRNANRTLISRSGNNALKFSPTPQMALQTMLSQGAEENGYLPLDRAMTAAFKDIQKHHVWTYAAMQKAAARFDETLSPKAIEAEGQVAKSTFGNQKVKLWERMQERWTSLSGAYDDGLVGVFTQYFTESYEELTSEDPEQNSGL